MSTQQQHIVKLIKNKETIFTYPLTQEKPLTIGREGCDILIENDPHISRVHAKISLAGDVAMITNTSSNGIFENDQELPKDAPRLFRAGHPVRLANGPYYLQLVTISGAAPSPDAAKHTSPPVQDYTLSPQEQQKEENQKKGPPSKLT
jgi:predicted component of type VI protein secretion system